MAKWVETYTYMAGAIEPPERSVFVNGWFDGWLSLHREPRYIWSYRTLQWSSGGSGYVLVLQVFERLGLDSYWNPMILEERDLVAQNS